MKRTTIFMDEILFKEFKEVSHEENKSVAGMIREAMEAYIVGKRKSPQKKLSFAGIGDSGRKDIAEKHEELLWREVEG
jgi:metal-responsive CopG/Arc/MetJ family transcriptional regulator